MRKTHDVCVSTGEYKKDGETKKRWLKVGVAFEDNDGNPVVKLEAIPLPKIDREGFPCIWLKFFAESGNSEPRRQRQNTPNNAPHHETEKPPF